MSRRKNLSRAHSAHTPSRFSRSSKSIRSTKRCPRQAIARRCAVEGLEHRVVLSVTSAGPAPDEPIVFAAGPLEFSGQRGDYLEVAHTDTFELADASFALSFTADNVEDRQALFSKDAQGYGSGGHLTAFVNDRRVEVRLQSEEGSAWLKTDDVLEPGAEHHLAVTLGANGFWVYLDGRLEGWKTGFHQGIESNSESLAIGANTWERSDEQPDLRFNFLDGTIQSFAIYDGQLSRQEVADLAGVAPREPLTEPTVIDGVLYGTDSEDWLENHTNVDGGYGDDMVMGTNQADYLDGGHGEDVLWGGDGPDILVSRSDGREPRLAQAYEPGQDDPYGELNPVTRTIYADQPIASDDLLFGGRGADIFRFEILVNAKINIILKHVNDDRTIDWHGVTGENRLVHDHWVDRIGDEVIWDFNRAEGDKIEFVGHTTDVYKVIHQDYDGDGVLDSSVLYVQSNQGNAGAHNKDKLGTVTVFGDLVTESDYTVNAQPAYGIVNTIDELGEAMAPLFGSPVVTDGVSRWLGVASIDDGDLPAGAVFAVPGEIPLSGKQGDYLLVEHTDTLALAEGTFALSFVADDVDTLQALFSKDAEGYGNGGHLTTIVNDGRVEVRLQSTDREVWLQTDKILQPGQQYDLAVTFGADGLRIYVDGQLEALQAGFHQSLVMNTENLAIGANIWGRTNDHPTWTEDFFGGTISGFTIYGSQLDGDALSAASTRQIAALAADAALAAIQDDDARESNEDDRLLVDSADAVDTALSYLGD